MQPVSQDWIDNQKLPLVSESYVEIEVNVGDPESQADAEASDNGSESWADTPSIAEEYEKDPQRYVTVEANMWVLDGTFKVLPDSGDYGLNGYIGSWICDENGVFETIPTITLSFSKVYGNTIPGVTITWGTAYDEYPTVFKVTAYNDSTIVAEKTISDNTSIMNVVEMDINNYNRITIEVLEWNLPYHRARIENILVGIARTYTKKDIMSYMHTILADPLSSELPKAEVKFELSNILGEYNPDNPEGLTKYLMERQKLNVRYGYKIGDSVEKILAGEFYMSEWDTPQNGITASFTARDVFEFMNDVYTGTTTGTLMDIATAALTQAELPLLQDGSVRWVIDSTLSGISAPSTVELDDDTTIAEVLQLVANAACMVLYQDRSGILHIEPLGDDQTDYEINRYVSYANAEISLTKQLKAVDINKGQAILSVGQTGETQSVENPFISDSQAPIVAAWVANILQNRKLLSGEYRSDPRLDALDRVLVENKFSESVVLITSVEYSYNGAFRGKYEGRANA